ncbi:hypothetical protein D3C85_1342590 [compost metagenome]
MNCTGVTSRNSHMPQVNQGRLGMGAQLSSVAPVASPRKAPARSTASASTPVMAMVTRVFIDFSSFSGDSKVRRQVSLQK